MYIGIGYILVFCQQLADIFWYWIYSANNWQIFYGIGYILPTIGRYMSIMGCWRRVADCAFTRMCIFFKKYILQPHTFQLTYFPQLLAEYIKYQYINSTNIYSQIVGRIYPIPTDILSSICIYLYWINTICCIQIIQGPDLPGPNLPGPDLPQQNFQGPNLPPRGPICRGPICRGPICRQGAQSAGAQFAGAQFAGAQFAGARFAADKFLGPNMPFLTIFWGPICRGPICRGPICRGPICRGPICRGPICHKNRSGPNLPGAQFA